MFANFKPDPKREHAIELGLRLADVATDVPSALDAIIAAVAATNDCVIVTDNEKDFFDIEIVNPIRDHGRE